MEKKYFRSFLINNGISENAADAIITCGTKAEAYLEKRFEVITSDDFETYKALVKLKKVDRAFGLATQFALEKYYEFQTGRHATGNLGNGIKECSDKEQTRETQVQLEVSTNGYYYFSLTDDSYIIRPEPNCGYFSLLAAMYRNENLITYSLVVSNPANFLKDNFTYAFNSMYERDADCISKHYGLEDGAKRTYESIGRDYNVTKERVKQIESRALRLLRHPSRYRRFFDFICTYHSIDKEERHFYGVNGDYIVDINEELRQHSDLMIRVRIPNNIMKAMSKMNVNSLAGLEAKQGNFSKTQKDKVAKIILTVHNASRIITEYENNN